MGTKSGACQAADNITRKIKKHESGKDVQQMCDQPGLRALFVRRPIDDK